MIDPYETMRKLLAISSPCGAPAEEIPEYQSEDRSVFPLAAWCSKCGQITIEPCNADDCPLPRSETMRHVNELGDLLAQECPLRDVARFFGIIAGVETEGKE